MKYAIEPVSKPRQSQRDKWQKRPCVMRYRAFCDECRLRGVHLPVAGAEVHFVLPMPKSWNAAKRFEMKGQPHQVKPDISNLLKALEDAVVKDDSKIWHYAAQSKTWGEEGSIEIITQEERYQVNCGPTILSEDFERLIQLADDGMNP